MFREVSLWDLSSGFLDGWCTCPSCLCPSLVGHESLLQDGPGLSSLVWWVWDWPSHEWPASTSLQLCPSFHTLTHWHSSANELHVVSQTSSALLSPLAAASSESFSISSISDKNPSKISLFSDLVVRQQCTECDHKWSTLSFHLWRQYAVSRCLGGSCADPPQAVSSGTAFPLPLSGGKMLSSNSTLLGLGDSCAPASNPPLTGGGLLVVLQSLMPLFSSSWRCELMVMLVRFIPDCPSTLLCDCLGHATFHFAITMLPLKSAVAHSALQMNYK